MVARGDATAHPLNSESGYHGVRQPAGRVDSAKQDLSQCLASRLTWVARPHYCISTDLGGGGGGEEEEA